VAISRRRRGRTQGHPREGMALFHARVGLGPYSVYADRPCPEAPPVEVWTAAHGAWRQLVAVNRRRNRRRGLLVQLSMGDAIQVFGLDCVD